MQVYLLSNYEGCVQQICDPECSLQNLCLQQSFVSDYTPWPVTCKGLGNEEYYYCCQDKYYFPEWYTTDPSCKDYFKNFKWDLEWFNATDCVDYKGMYKDFDSFDISAIVLQTFAAAGLCFVALTICGSKDKRRRVTAHP